MAKIIEIKQDQTMIIPDDLVLGVQGDNEVKRLYFTCPRYTESGDDLSLFNVKYLVYMTPHGEIPDPMLVSNEATTDDAITFDVPVTANMTKYRGYVGIGLCFKKAELDWNVHNALIPCASGYHVENPIAEYPDLAQQIITLIEEGGTLVTQLGTAKNEITDLVVNGNAVIGKVYTTLKDATAEAVGEATEAAAESAESALNAQKAAESAVTSAEDAALLAQKYKDEAFSGTPEGYEQIAEYAQQAVIIDSDGMFYAMVEEG